MTEYIDYETITVKSKIKSGKDIKAHDNKINDYLNTGWRIVYTTIGSEEDGVFHRTVLRKSLLFYRHNEDKEPKII